MTQVCKFTASNGEARRTVTQGGVTFDGEKITDPRSVLKISGEGQVLKVGKRKFGKII